MKDSAILEAFLSLVLLLFLRYNLRFSLAYKRKSRAPHEEDRSIGPSRPDRIQIRTRARHEHTAEQRSSSQHPLAPFTRDLGSFPSLVHL